MAVTSQRPFPKWRAYDTNGDPLSGGKLYTYAAGTTTELETYSDTEGLVANTNPVILDANGEADIKFQPLNYKLVLKDANDVLLWTEDNFAGSPYPITDEWIAYVHTWTYISATQVSVPGDQTAIYTTNKAVRAVCTGGTFYGTITASAYDGSTKTTLTVSFDSGSFDSGVSGSSTISIGVQSNQSPALYYAQTAISAPGTSATSTTSLTIGSGSKSLTIQTGKSIVVGMSVKIAYTNSPTDWMFGDVTSYDSETGALAVDVTRTSGSGTQTAWTISLSGVPGPSATVPISQRTSNAVLTYADLGYLIDITSGTFTQTFDACASLSAGWYCWLRNSGDGDITLDPNGAETIDELSSYIMYPGEVRLVQCDGSELRSAVIQPFYKAFTSSGTFTKPPGYKYFGGLAWSGGASGQRTNSATTLSRGGSGGGCSDFLLPASTVSATEIVTIGAGGAAVTTVATGNVGGNTSLGSLVLVYAGTTYIRGGSVISGMITSSATYANYEGQDGGINVANYSVYGGISCSANGSVNGGLSVYGGGCGGCLDTAATVRSPGASRFGGDGGAASSASNGTDGTAPGGGGGATQTGTQSGAGARGELRIWGIA